MPDKKETSSLFTLGLDIGSLTGKAVLLDGNKKIISQSVVQRGFVSEKAIKTAMENVLEAAGLELNDVAYVVSTGYGRRKLSFADKNLTEISCHARGANYLYPEARTVIDIGGQDSKVISVDSSGHVQKFAMNDKCAGGTGQFMDVLARALDVELDEIGELSLQSTNNIKMNSMCATFAETEVISLVTEGHSNPDILNGVHGALSRRMTGLVGRVGLREPVMLTGGVAKNVGLVHTLENKLNVPIYIPEDPQVVGALGAALFAFDHAPRSDESSEAEQV